MLLFIFIRYKASSIKMSNQHLFLLQRSDKIPDTSDTHGIGQNWTYVLYNHFNEREIRVVVVSSNEHYLHSAYQTPGLIFHMPGK